MPRIDVPFTVTEQVLRQYPPTLLRAGDKNYFYATFNVCEKWADVAELRAVFERSDLERPYVQDLVQGNGCYECVIPWEVMQTPGLVRVGVFGGDRILTNKVNVSVSVGCSCDGDTPQSPTRDWFLKIEELIQELGTPDPEAIAAAVADYIAKNPIEEKDPTVPEWAKADKKPEYTAKEVGAIAENEFQTAINTALAQAKASGEFDGADGSPGADGKDGVDGQPGADGSPGKDGADGKDGVSCTHSWDGTVLTVTSASGTSSADLKGDKGETGEPGTPGAAGADGYTPVKGTDYFTEADKQEIAEAAAEKVSIPEALPNPNALTFTGAATGSYDGSQPMTVNIPSGGGGDNPWRLITDLTLEEDVASFTITADDDGNGFELDELYVITNAISITSTAINVNIKVNGKELFGFPCGKSGDDQTMYRNMAYLRSLNPMIVFEGTWLATNTERAKTLNWNQPKLSTLDTINANFPLGTKITKIELYKTPTAATAFAAGSRFVILGR